MITDWTDAYENGKYIEGAADFPLWWIEQAEEYRVELGGRAKLDIPYGRGERQKYDLFMPEDRPKGLAVFVHGGYWRAFDKSCWSHLAAGANTQGWAVCMPSYTLAPQARISQITQEIAQAITKVADEVAGPIRLAGHSAGGHLVSRMACVDVDLPVADRMQHVLSISGLHDMRPLIQTEMNSVLCLDPVEATAESAALQTPRKDIKVTAWVGAKERPEFLRQNDLLANIWTGFGIETKCHHAAGQHHFNVIEGLADENSPITRAFVGVA